MDNPHIDIKEITNESLDAQLVADAIALQLERKGSLKFKIIAYNTIASIMRSGALGTEISLSGKLPSERAKTWRFAQGYLKKTGDPSKVVMRAQAQAKTPMGVVGIKVSILPPDAHIHDQIIIDDVLIRKLKDNLSGQSVKLDETIKKKSRKKTKMESGK